MVKIQIEVEDKRAEEIETLMRKCGIKTETDWVNNAFTLLEWAISERKRGRSIASVDETNQTFREVVLPCFEHVQIEKEEVKPAAA